MTSTVEEKISLDYPTLYYIIIHCMALMHIYHIYTYSIYALYELKQCPETNAPLPDMHSVLNTLEILMEIYTIHNLTSTTTFLKKNCAYLFCTSLFFTFPFPYIFNISHYYLIYCCFFYYLLFITVSFLHLVFKAQSKED